MASRSFNNLEESVKELKRIYLNDGNFRTIPNPDDQELARAFIVLVHAELEQYIETSFEELSIDALKGVSTGQFSRVAISLLAFSGIPAQTGGAKLRMPTSGGSAIPSTGKKDKSPRLLATRYGEAHGQYLQMLASNNGVREKYLAALGIPLGLDAQRIDPNWINDLELFCSSRGVWAHLSRTNHLAKIGEIDPRDIWAVCERLIWTNRNIATPGVISSFEDLDQWVEAEKNLIGNALVNEPRWKFKVFYAMSMLWCYWKRRNDKAKNEE